MSYLKRDHTEYIRAVKKNIYIKSFENDSFKSYVKKDVI